MCNSTSQYLDGIVFDQPANQKLERGIRHPCARRHALPSSVVLQPPINLYACGKSFLVHMVDSQCFFARSFGDRLAWSLPWWITSRLWPKGEIFARKSYTGTEDFYVFPIGNVPWSSSWVVFIIKRAPTHFWLCSGQTGSLFCSSISSDFGRSRAFFPSYTLGVGIESCY